MATIGHIVPLGFVLLGILEYCDQPLPVSPVHSELETLPMEVHMHPVRINVEGCH